MSRVPDRKKQRREYLRKKGRYYLLALTLALSGVAIWYGIVHVTSNYLWLFVTLMFGLPTIVQPLFEAAWKMFCGAKSVPYIPSVTPSTVPAEETLVRGAAEPSAPSETLLRAAKAGDEGKAEELLEAVKLLLDHHADLRLKDRSGETPLAQAEMLLRYRSQEPAYRAILQLLLQAGATM